MGVIDKAKTRRARLIAGGERLGGELADGYFISPTVFADVDNATPLARDEIFGPVVAVMPFDTEDEAIRIANDSPFGLAGYIQTSNLKRAHTVAQQLQVGNIWINGFLGIPRLDPVRWRANKAAGADSAASTAFVNSPNPRTYM